MSKTKTQAVIVEVKFCFMMQNPVGQLFPETVAENSTGEIKKYQNSRH